MPRILPQSRGIAVVPAEAAVVIALDETIERRWGPLPHSYRVSVIAV
jgi:hypothetical protein